MARRSLEIGAAVAAASSMGIEVAFCTLTMRHNRGDSLAKCWDGLAKGWRRATSGKAWQQAKAAHGVVGYVRVVEVTYGRNGWHVHVHALIFGSGLVQAGGLDRLMLPMWERWSAGLQSQGLRAPLPVASEWHEITGDLSGTELGEYLAKGAGAAGAIGMELTQTQSKVARSVHSTAPTWDLLRAGPMWGEVEALKRWREWERGSKGRRQIAWSRGLREHLGLVAADRTDEEIAAEEVGDQDDTVVWITRDGWGWLIRNPAWIGELLEVAEASTPETFSRWLDERGIEHRRT